MRDEFQSPALEYRSEFGWQVSHYSGNGWLVANVPTGKGTFKQYIYNSLLPPPDGWTCFRGQDAHCWGFLDGDIYFGGRGAVSV